MDMRKRTTQNWSFPLRISSVNVTKFAVVQWREKRFTYFCILFVNSSYLPSKFRFYGFFGLLGLLLVCYDKRLRFCIKFIFSKTLNDQAILVSYLFIRPYNCNRFVIFFLFSITRTWKSTYFLSIYLCEIS